MYSEFGDEVIQEEDDQIFIYDDEDVVKIPVTSEEKTYDLDDILNNSVEESDCDYVFTNKKNIISRFRDNPNGEESDIVMLCDEVLDIYISEQERKQVIYGVRVYVTENRTIWTIPYKEYRSVEEILEKGYLSNEEKNRLSEKHYNMIEILAKKFSDSYRNYSEMSYDNVYEACVIGFTKALNAYSKKYRDVKFVTVASRCMSNEVIDLYRKIVNITPTVAIDDESEDSTNTVSSNKLYSDSSEKQFSNYENSEIISQFFEALTDEETFIMERYFGLNGMDVMTQQQIAKELYVTQASIASKIKKALSKMKTVAENNDLSFSDFFN